MNDSRLEESARMMNEHIGRCVLSSVGSVQDLKDAWTDFVRQANINQTHRNDRTRYREFLRRANECGIKLNGIILRESMEAAGFSRDVRSQYVNIFSNEGWG